jgi:hypothetical protein
MYETAVKGIGKIGKLKAGASIKKEKWISV